MLTKDTQIKALTRPGSYHIGNGAYVQVSPTVTKSFKFRYTRRGKAREMGLGPYPEVTLAEARQKALDARKALADGLDPIEVRDAQRRIQDAPKHTFQAVALEYIAAHEVEWKNPKHRAQWKSSLRDYAFPVIGTIPVDQITADEIYSVLIQGTPDGSLWHARTETASRVRQRIETILSYAKARKWRTGENPAAWKDNLQPRLAAKAKISPVRHHEALPYRDMPVLLAAARIRA